MKNNFKTIENIKENKGLIWSPVIITYESSNKDIPNQYLLVIIDLKTSKIVNYRILNHRVRSGDVNNALFEILNSSRTKNNSDFIHTLNGTPFTTNIFKEFLTEHGLKHSLYSRHEILPIIETVKLFIKKFYEFYNETDLINFIKFWNDHFTNILIKFITKYENNK
jgi:transposase InsO family protein